MLEAETRAHSSAGKPLFGQLFSTRAFPIINPILLIGTKPVGTPDERPGAPQGSIVGNA
jgi:hypothetical protein